MAARKPKPAATRRQTQAPKPKPKATRRRAPKPKTGVRRAQARIENGDYDVAGTIRAPERRSLRGKAAKEADHERMATNASWRLRYHSEPEYQEAERLRKKTEYHKKTVTNLVANAKPADVRRAASRLKSRAKSKKEFEAWLETAVENGRVSSADVRKALAE